MRLRGHRVLHLVGKGNKPATMPLTVPILRALEALTTSPRASCGPGFDSRGRLLEIVVPLLDNGTEFVIDTMKARPQYLNLLP